tara:strand:- start:184 stop:522 length:339 start_codon:yes stop_codon:yes gene_type:complete
MSLRYDNRVVFTNIDDIYFHLLEERGRKSIVQYSTPVFKKLSDEEESALSVSTVTWKLGSRLYKLAAESYGNSRLWWIIARFNHKPTDAHFKLGDTVYIPYPLETILGHYRD